MAEAEPIAEEPPHAEVAPRPAKKSSALAIDIAESIYQREIEILIRQLAESTLKEELAAKLKYQKPVFESIYDPMLTHMIKDIAKEVIDDHERKIQILQTHEIKKAAREKIVNDLMLDHMLDTVAQHGKSVAENDEVTKLLDSMELIFYILTILFINNNV